MIIQNYVENISPFMYLVTVSRTIEAMFSFLKITIYVPLFSSGPFANKKRYDVTP